MPEFHGDAVILSGETGTRLKCQIIGEYYKLWWEITSGGPGKAHVFPTSLVEMNAGTGEDYIEETNETILGSAGHALELKLNHPHTANLKVVLVEDDLECSRRLRNVIRRKWPQLLYDETPVGLNKSGVFLFNKKPADVLPSIGVLELGNALFFFDPLLYTPRTEIETLARNRLKTYYQTGTEFIVFLFTSDWFVGRGQLSPLPDTVDEK